MARITFETSGSGNIRKILPDWSVQVEATPLAIGDQNGGAGGISFSAERTGDSEFLVGNECTVEHIGDKIYSADLDEYNETSLGRIFGYADVVNLSGKYRGDGDIHGTTVDIDVSTQINKFVTNVTAETITDRSVLDGGVFSTEVGDASLPLKPLHYIASHTGQTIWVIGESSPSLYMAARYGPDNVAVSNDLWAIDPSTIRGLACDDTGVIWVAYMNGTTPRVSRWFDGAVTHTWGAYGPGHGMFDWSNDPVGMVYYPDTGYLYVTDSENNRYQVFTTAGTHVSSVPTNPNLFSPKALAIKNDLIYIAGLDSAIKSAINVIGVYDTTGSYYTSINMFLQGDQLYSYPLIYVGLFVTDMNRIIFVGDAGGNLIFTMYEEFAGTYMILMRKMLGASSTTISAYAEPFIYYGKSSANQLWGRRYILGQPNAHAAAAYMTGLVGVPLNGFTASNPDAFFPGWTGDLWTKIKEFCAAKNIELAISVDGVTFRNAGATEISSDKVVAGSQRLSLDSSASGRSININYYNYSNGGGITSLYTGRPDMALMYDARDDDRILSIDVGQTVTETIVTNSYPTELEPPYHSSSLSQAAGSYYVIGSDDLPVSAQQWLDYGGGAYVAINAESKNSIDVTLTGPREAIPGVNGPFRFAISDGDTVIPYFSVVGYGLTSEPKTLNLLSGANPERTVEEVAADIDNIFIGTLDEAYDRGSWALPSASGPQISLSIELPIYAFTTFELIPGSIIQYNENYYRIVEANVNIGTVSITAQPYVTVGDFDTLVSGDTVSDFDSDWSTLECQDFRIKPFHFIDGLN